MWLEKLNAAIELKGYNNKILAEKSHVSEKTIARIRSGGASRPYLDTLGDLAAALDITLEEIFSESNARIASGDLTSLQNDVDRLTTEINMLTAENAMLKEKVGVLTSENDLLRIKLEHKEEIITIHNYYNSIIKNMDK